MNRRSLDILERLQNTTKLRANRLTDTLKNPEEDYTRDWYMCVPKCFNDALDIKQTIRVVKEEEGKKEKLVWTQGSNFSFKIGDTIYDTPLAYSLPWSKALQHMAVAIQIKQVIDKVESIKSSSDVVFEIFLPDVRNMRLNKICEHTLSQDMFVKFLVSGPEGELKKHYAP